MCVKKPLNLVRSSHGETLQVCVDIFNVKEKSANGHAEDLKDLISEGLTDLHGQECDSGAHINGKSYSHVSIVLLDLSFPHFIQLVYWGCILQMSLWICCHTLAQFCKYLLSSHIQQVTGETS